MMRRNASEAASFQPVIWITDASPIIVLAKSGSLDLLTGVSAESIVPARRIIITETVAREIEAGQKADPARRVLSRGWGERVPDVSPSTSLAQWDLDAGEETVLALAMISPHALAVIDDADARRAALALGIRYTGTLGVALQARQSGQIGELAPLIRTLRAAGLFLPSDAALHTVLQNVGETWP